MRKIKRKAYLRHQNRKRQARLHRINVRRYKIKKRLREKRNVNRQIRKNEKQQRKAASHPISLIVPSDFCLLQNPKECTDFFYSLQNKENAYMLGDGSLHISLYMEHIERIDFAAVMMLETICEDLSHSQCYVNGDSPKDDDVLKFLHDAGFYNMKFDTKGRRIFDPGNRQSIDIQMGEKIIQLKNLYSLINLMKRSREHLTVDDSVSIDNYVAMLKEICGNSTEWGNNIRKNWTVAAKFEEGKVQFVALDLGQGIIKSLNKRFKDRMLEFFSNKLNHEVLMDVFQEYYGSKSKDPNRNQGLPFIKKCSDASIVKSLHVISNNAIIGLSDSTHNSTFAKNNKGLKGTLYSWSIDIDCLKNKL